MAPLLRDQTLESGQNIEKITAVKELPPEFKKHETPFGMEQHHWNRISCGVSAHVFGGYYLLYLLPFGIVPRTSFFLAFLYGLMAGIGTTAGSHRYWTHRTFKARLPLQVLLMLFQTSTFSYPIFKWCRDHRVHHKYTDTDADPHNSKRGFWFCHIGWLFQPKHPELEKALQTVDISDLANDPVVRFQSRYFLHLVFIMCLVLPMSLCHFFFPEMTLVQIFSWNMFWYAAQLHASFCVNSFAHMWGDKPFDKYITAQDNKWVAAVAIGEGWHNYHHTFPWDYKAAELGWKLNLSTMFIDLFAWIGWAYDLKTVSHKLLLQRIRRTGDGCHPLLQKEMEAEREQAKVEAEAVEEEESPNHCWGWGDLQLRKEDVEITETLRARKAVEQLNEKLQVYKTPTAIL